MHGTSTPFPRLPLLRAENLARAGFSHAFGTRVGGASVGAYASLNFGSGDDAAAVSENVRRFAEGAGFAPSELRQVTQVHGARVVNAASLADSGARVEADALVLDALEPGSAARAIGVRVADCAPVLVGARDGGAVAAIHAGWRGVVAGVVSEALARLRGKERVAAIGPCIGSCCFEVGADVARQIAGACGDPAVVVRTEGEKAFVDLRRAIRAQLARDGVTDVEDVTGCTRCEPERFFSYRRDGAASGRHLAAIVVRA